MKLKTILIFLFLLLQLSCSTTNIDLKNIDIEWQHELDFYTNNNDILLIVDDTLLLTHYSRRTDIETLKSSYFENIYKFDKNTGELLEYKFEDDSLTARDISWSFKNEKYANRRTWPAFFNMGSDYDISIEIDKFNLFHYTTRSYTLEIKKDSQVYKINLDELGEIRIEFYLMYSNELYLWIHSDNKDYNRVGSFLYKLNIDNLIRKYR